MRERELAEQRGEIKIKKPRDNTRTLLGKRSVNLTRKFNSSTKKQKPDSDEDYNEESASEEIEQNDSSVSEIEEKPVGTYG